jgi:hypothetical protein
MLKNAVRRVQEEQQQGQWLQKEWPVYVIKLKDGKMQLQVS